MEWLMGILLIIAGAAIGFFAARFYIERTGASAALAKQAEEHKQQFDAYRRDVSEQLETARQLSEQVGEVQDKLHRFLNDSQQLLEQEKDWQQPLPFFAEETVRQLRREQPQSGKPVGQSEATEDSENPPRDYSEPGSGLFSDQTAHKKT